MKKLILLSLTIVAITFSCGEKKETKANPDWAINGTIYELNIRQATPQGTFAAATEQLERLKELGVDIIWVMPIQPIGVKERKGVLGSYYAIRDYKGFNPEFGRRADFQAFVGKAHDLGMKVILDWVANHTSPDHPWTEKEGWHERDSVGNLVVMYDWTDIAPLNYDNKDMRAEMVKEMKFWIDSIKLDGFRCDVAMEVPTDFWEEAVVELKKSKPDLFMLAEAEEVGLTVKAFDMHYGWKLHHVMNDVAQSKIKMDSIWNYFKIKDSVYPKRAFAMEFTSNHDENSWNGTEFERMGEKGAEAMAVFTYVVPGMPLIYTGQEYGLNKRLRFFDKDTVTVNAAAPQTQMYKNLNAFRKANPAVWSGEKGGDLVRLENNVPEKVFSMKRSIPGNEVVAVFNFAGEPTEVTVRGIAGKMKQYPSGEEVDVVEAMTMKPWEYRVYYK